MVDIGVIERNTDVSELHAGSLFLFMDSVIVDGRSARWVPPRDLRGVLLSCEPYSLSEGEQCSHCLLSGRGPFCHLMGCVEDATPFVIKAVNG